MSKIAEHRIYKYMSEPFRFLNLTVDEIFLSLGGFLGCMLNSGNFFLQSGFLIGGVGGAFVLKKVKKQKVGMSFKSFLCWHGILKPPSKHYPPHHNRFYLP